MKVFGLICLLASSALACQPGALDPNSPTSRYVAMLKRLVVEKRAMPLAVAREIAASERPFNPFALEDHKMRGSEARPFRIAFDTLLGEGLAWNHVREAAARLVHEETQAGGQREKAVDGAKPLVFPKVIHARIFDPLGMPTPARLEVGANGDAYVIYGAQTVAPRVKRIRNGKVEEISMPPDMWYTQLVRAEDGDVYAFGVSRANSVGVVNLATGAVIHNEVVPEAWSLFGKYTLLPSIRAGEKSLHIVLLPNFAAQGAARSAVIPFGGGTTTVQTAQLPTGVRAVKVDGTGYYIAHGGAGKIAVFDTSVGRDIFETEYRMLSDGRPPRLRISEGVAGNPVLLTSRPGFYDRFDIGKKKQTSWSSKDGDVELTSEVTGDPQVYRVFGGFEPGTKPEMEVFETGKTFPVATREIGTLDSFRVPDGRHFVITKPVRKPDFTLTDVTTGNSDRFNDIGMLVGIRRLPDGRVIAVTSGDGVSVLQLYGP